MMHEKVRNIYIFLLHQYRHKPFQFVRLFDAKKALRELEEENGRTG
jgi:hypothetical protein